MPPDSPRFDPQRILEHYAVDERGLNRSSFYVYLSYSPVIERFAPGVYGLRGAEVTAAAVEALIPPRARTQVLQDHGWTDDGAIWVATAFPQRANEAAC